MIRLMYGRHGEHERRRGQHDARRAPPTRCSPGGISETAGNQWNTLVANSRTSPMPITNSGSAASTRRDRRADVVDRAVALHRQPARRSRSTAGSRPARRRAPGTRSWRRAPTAARCTGCCVAAEVPKLPVSTPPTHCRYWLTTESSRLSCSRSAATRSGVASRPRIAVAASPGQGQHRGEHDQRDQPQGQEPESSRLTDQLAHGAPPARLGDEADVLEPVVAEREAATWPRRSRRASRCRRR